METSDYIKIMNDWKLSSLSFGVFRDPQGKMRADFVHCTDKLVALAEGEIEIENEGKPQSPTFGEELFIPENALHTMRNMDRSNNLWNYG